MRHKLCARIARILSISLIRAPKLGLSACLICAFLQGVHAHHMCASPLRSNTRIMCAPLEAMHACNFPAHLQLGVLLPQQQVYTLNPCILQEEETYNADASQSRLAHLLISPNLTLLSPIPPQRR